MMGPMSMINGRAGSRWLAAESLNVFWRPLQRVSITSSQVEPIFVVEYGSYSDFRAYRRAQK
jgi:hypothetical protein